MKIKAPSDVVEYIKSKFQLVDGKVVKNDGSIPSFTIINKRNYSMSYVKDVLEGKDPDLSVLFDTIDGKLYRNQDPVWGTRGGMEVTNSGTIVCGVKVFNTGYIKLERPVFERPVFKHIEIKRDTLALEPLVVSEYMKECIKDRFRIKNGEVVYIKGDEPFGDYATIAGMHYSRSYVQQVLENKNPDISDLFEFREGVVCRSQDPIWGLYKGERVTYTRVCGIIFLFTMEGYVIPEPPEPPEQKPTEEYELLN